MSSKIDKLALHRSIVHAVELAVRAERGDIDDAADDALNEAVKVLDAHRREVDWRQMQAEVTFLIEGVLVPLYEHIQEHPLMTEAEIETRLVADARRHGFELAREVLDDLVLRADEITGIGAVKAAAEAVGYAVGRSGRSILKWMAESEAFPPSMSARSGLQAANMLLHVAGLLRIEAAQQGREALVDKLTSVIEFIQGKPNVAPPPVALEARPFVPPAVQDPENGPT